MVLFVQLLILHLLMVLTIQIKIENLPSFTEFLDKSVSGSIFMADCTAEEISKIISELENGKSSDIPIRVIKRSSKLTSPILERHFNCLMHDGIFPDELKLGRITPIYKKGDDELLEIKKGDVVIYTPDEGWITS